MSKLLGIGTIECGLQADKQLLEPSTPHSIGLQAHGCRAWFEAGDVPDNCGRRLRTCSEISFKLLRGSHNVKQQTTRARIVLIHHLMCAAARFRIASTTKGLGATFALLTKR